MQTLAKQAFPSFRRRHRPRAVYIPFIAIIKLLFNFDGS
jgi:hypothetical protein